MYSFVCSIIYQKTELLLLFGFLEINEKDFSNGKKLE